MTRRAGARVFSPRHDLLSRRTYFCPREAFHKFHETEHERKRDSLRARDSFALSHGLAGFLHQTEEVPRIGLAAVSGTQIVDPLEISISPFRKNIGNAHAERASRPALSAPLWAE